MNLAPLEQTFLSYDLSPLTAIANTIATRGAAIFPPYVPRVGVKYEAGGVAIYGTAQNFPPNSPFADRHRRYEQEDPLRLVRRLFYCTDAPDWRLCRSCREVDIAPYAAGVLPALAGLALYLWAGEPIADLESIDRRVVATNYYKFSLRDGRRDLNPNTLPAEYERYRALNDRLCELELEYLRPAIVIAQRGWHVGMIQRVVSRWSGKVLEINDPAWILRGGGGCLKETGSWGEHVRRVSDEAARALVSRWVSQIEQAPSNGDRRYAKKKAAVEIYLLRYFKAWRENGGSAVISPRIPLSQSA